ncbi:hypothetical protein HYH03_003960 [Edaphochlamys debaryana]|uniref:Uncharacterized protein n=1 Tax=Edaphochlamys debaryana TaxID=47281 RepID=A0A835YAN0_9CHLO|nr:hypothetical protein HYH03_003960 [Edaphochlamys debaryana]|eukprot:KAG2498209.1 hypothetical protein HYH03_003960 [Edaphochlamys debaryana]
MDFGDMLTGLCAQARKTVYNALADKYSSVDVTNARLACASLRDLVDEEVPELRFRLGGTGLKPDELASLCKQGRWLMRWPSARKIVIAVHDDEGSDIDMGNDPAEGPTINPDPSPAEGTNELGYDVVSAGLVAQMEGLQELSIEGMVYTFSEVRALLEALPSSVRRFSVGGVEPDASADYHAEEDPEDQEDQPESEPFELSCTLAGGKVVSLTIRTPITTQHPWQGESRDTDFDELLSSVEALLPPSRAPATQLRGLSTSLVAPAGEGMPRFGPKFLDLVSRCEETCLEELELEVCSEEPRASAAAVVEAVERLGMPRALRWRWWWAPRRGETIRVALRPPAGNAPTGPPAPSVGLGSGGSPIDATGVVQLAIQRMLMSYAPTGSPSGPEAAADSPPPAASPSAPSHMLLTGPAIAKLVGTNAGVDFLMEEITATLVAACTPAASGAACSQQQAPAAAPAAVEAEAGKGRQEERGAMDVLRYRELPWAQTHVIELSCGSEAAAAALQRLGVPFLKQHMSAAAAQAAAAAVHEEIQSAAALRGAAAALQEAAAAGGVEVVPCRLDVTQAIAETLEALWAGEEPGAPGLGVDGLERLRWLLDVWAELLHLVPHPEAAGFSHTRPSPWRWWMRDFPGGMRVRRLGLAWA